MIVQFKLTLITLFEKLYSSICEPCRFFCTLVASQIKPVLLESLLCYFSTWGQLYTVHLFMILIMIDAIMQHP